MRQLIYLLIILTFTACNDFKVKDSETSTTNEYSTESLRIKPDDTVQRAPENLDQIKSSYAATMEKFNNESLDSIVLRYNCQNERSGTITYFSEKGKLLMINHSYAEYDHYQVTDKYFVQDEQLYFSFQQQLVWSFEQGKAAESATKDEITELRTYIIDQKPILCLEKKYTIHSSSSVKPDIAQIPNKTIKCKSVKKFLATYNKLKNFKNLSNRDCFEK